jgi:hypothetical protein
MDLDEPIRVRVTDLKFTQQQGGPSLTEEELAVMAPGAAAATLAPSVVEAAAAKKTPKKPTIANFEPPMKVIVRGHSTVQCALIPRLSAHSVVFLCSHGAQASIKDDGLGLLSWWD